MTLTKIILPAILVCLLALGGSGLQGPATTKGKEIACTITTINPTTAVLECNDESVLEVPLAEWPEPWRGPHDTVGQTFRALWRDDHLLALPTRQWCLDQQCERGDYCRPSETALQACMRGE